MTTDLDIWAAMFAARLAQLIGLPIGNMWEPGIARALLRDSARGGALSDIEAEWRLRLGLEEPA